MTSEILAFVSTMIATLIGVFLAVTLSKRETQRKERSDTIKLLKSAKSILDLTFDYVLGLEIYLTEIEKKPIETHPSLSEVKEKNPIPFPDLMETIITSEIVSKNLTAFSHSEIYNGLINLRKVSNYNSINTYKRVLSELGLLLDLEIAFQKREINFEGIENRLEEGRIELKKQFPDDEDIKTLNKDS